MLTNAEFIKCKTQYKNININNNNVLIYYYNKKITVFNINTNSFDGKAELSAIITAVFSATWSFRNHSNMLIWGSRNIYYGLKQLWNILKRAEVKKK